MDECIIREAAHEMMRNLPRYVNKEIRDMYGVNEMVDYDVVQHGLDNLPAADVRKNVRSRYEMDVCLNCGKLRPMQDAFGEYIHQEDIVYCWYCGTDMRRGEKDD